jgi:hypothetical protein
MARFLPKTRTLALACVESHGQNLHSPRRFRLPRESRYKQRNPRQGRPAVQRQTTTGEFNLSADLPYELRLRISRWRCRTVYDFFYDVNQLLSAKGLHRLDDMLRPARMSGMISDMLTASMAKHSRTLVENRHFNGHPDLIVRGRYSQNSVAAGARHRDQEHSKNWWRS